MHRRSLLATLPLIVASPALAHPPRQPDGAEAKSLIEEIKVFREKVARVVTAKDRSALRALYADAFTYTDDLGTLHDRDARLAAALAGEPMIENAPATELSYRVFAGPTIVVTGKSAILNAKERRTYDLRWVTIYVTGVDGWLIAASQATRLPA
jgi:hypothetical protein